MVRSAIAVGVEPRDPQHFRSVIQLRKETQGIAECLIFIGVSVAIFNLPRRNDRGLKRVLAGGSIRPGVLIARDRLIRLAVNRPVEVCSPWDWQMVCAVAAEDNRVEPALIVQEPGNGYHAHEGSPRVIAV